jgi:hypothetical protein
VQVKVRVCGYEKETAIVKTELCNKKPEAIFIKQDVDFMLRGDEARRPGEVIHIDVWDVHMIPDFQVASTLRPSA